MNTNKISLAAAFALIAGIVILQALGGGKYAQRYYWFYAEDSLPYTQHYATVAQEQVTFKDEHLDGMQSKEGPYLYGYEAITWPGLWPAKQERPPIVLYRHQPNVNPQSK